MPRTFKEIRQGALRTMGVRHFFGTADSSGNGTTLLVAAGLKKYPDGYFTGLWLEAHSGGTSGEIVRITAFTSANGEITPDPNFTTAPHSDDFEISTVDPELLTDAINSAALRMYPLVAQNLRYESFVSGSPVTDPGFEDWTSTSALRYYTASSVTQSRQTGGLQGTYFARLTTAATGYLGLTTAERVELAQLAGSTITVYAIVRASTSSDARLRVVDSATTTNGSYHSGGGNWELISVEHTFTSAATGKQDTFDVRFMHDNATTNMDIDHWWIEGGPGTVEMRLPQVLARGPLSVFTALIENREDFRHRNWLPTDARMLTIEDTLGVAATQEAITRIQLALPPGRAVMVVGRAALPALSADTEEWPLDELSGELVELEAASILFGWERGLITADDNRSVDEHIADIERRKFMIERMLRRRRNPANLPLR